MSSRVRRVRTTRASVKLAERVAGALISVGGLGTIAAVSLIMVFLVWVAAPLLGGATLGEEARARLEPSAAESGGDGSGAAELDGLVEAQVDEYRALLWTLTRDGEFVLRRLDRGDVLVRRALGGDARPTAIGVDVERGSLALGFADGTVRLGALDFVSETLHDAGATPFERLAAGEREIDGERLVERAADGSLRSQTCRVELDEPLDTATGSGVVLIDQLETDQGRTLATLHANGTLALYRVVERENLMTGEVTRKLVQGRVEFEAPAGFEPRALMVSSGGATALLVAADGRVARFDTRDLESPALAELVDLLPESDARVTCARFLLGRTTLLVGDDRGGLGAFFVVKPDGAPTCDGGVLVRARELGRPGSAVRALATSQRTRLIAAAYADGSVHAFNATSAKDLGRLDVDGPVLALALAPKDDALVAVGPRSVSAWGFDPKHSEVTFASLFRPVWYEGYSGPEHVWQSSSGTDDFEPKLGLMPLVFGTLKATLYSLMFGVPIAILAALFSSEFLSPRVRVPIKSTVEIMAGLPSVVLGFLAAVIFAPFVQDIVPAVLAGFATLPLALLSGAYLWQLLPQRVALRFADWRRFVCIVAMLPLGVLAAARLGPWLEAWLYAGDVKLWLAGERGGPIGGWMLLFAPLSALVVAVVGSRWATPWLRSRSFGWNRGACARADLARFAVNVGATLVLALALSALVWSLGFDPRGSFVGTFVQRNALVVGFVMGFAIIPIIYTIAEDALTSVPEHLRLASLAAGATPWQTAVHVILPTAASGLFSAVMVGLGRAVGETMIVLMATGNTPVMSWNVFSGFRTLSANIATELPEAVKNSTHYRTLFLAALLLFAMTFVVNTAAEVVRQRFRRRAFQL